MRCPTLAPESAREGGLNCTATVIMFASTNIDSILKSGRYRELKIKTHWNISPRILAERSQAFLMSISVDNIPIGINECAFIQGAVARFLRMFFFLEDDIGVIFCGVSMLSGVPFFYLVESILETLMTQRMRNFPKFLKVSKVKYT